MGRKAINQVLMAIAFILATLLAMFGLFSNPTDKKIALWAGTLAICAALVYILLILRHEHIKNQPPIDRITPAIQLTASKPTIENPPPEQAKSEPPPVKPSEPIRTNPAPSARQPDWTQYKEDYIQGILWRWHYKPHTGDRPLDLTPYCYECKVPTELQHWIGPYGMEDNITWLMCPRHYRQYRIVGNYHRQYASIEDIIQANIASDKWKKIVARQAGTNRLW